MTKRVSNIKGAMGKRPFSARPARSFKTWRRYQAKRRHRRLMALVDLHRLKMSDALDGVNLEEFARGEG